MVHQICVTVAVLSFDTYLVQKPQNGGLSMTLQASARNKCIVKYIHLSSVDPGLFHTTSDYEMCKVTIEHSTYDELHEAVFSNCPDGYVCREPLALYHEVLWSTGIRVIQDTGENERVRLERDELHHAIEVGEYNVLWVPGKPSSDNPLSICVDIDEDTSSSTVPIANLLAS